MAIFHEQVAALLRRALHLRAVPQIVEPFLGRCEPYAHAASRDLRERLLRARARVPQLAVRDAAARGDAGAGTFARVDEPARPERVEHRGIDRLAIALPAAARARAERVGGRLVWNQSEPVEVIEDGALELGAAPIAIVIFDAEQHAATQRPRQAPHEDRVGDVSQVQVAGRGRREPRDQRLTASRVRQQDGPRLADPPLFPGRPRRSPCARAQPIEQRLIGRIGFEQVEQHVGELPRR